MNLSAATNRSGCFDRLGKCPPAADLVRLLKNNGCGYGYQAGSKMSNGHLVLDGPEAVMGCLFYFSITKASIVLFNDLASLEGFFVFLAVSGNSGPSIVGDIDVFGAIVAFAGIERRMIGWASATVFLGDLLTHLQRAAKFDPLAFWLSTVSGRFHFQAGLT